MNIYVVLLEKSRSLRPGCYEKDFGKNILGSWITLGHFDAMYAYKLEQEDKNLFQVIGDNSDCVARANTGDSYYHPLYLISSYDKREDDDFWSEQASFFAVTRIHFAESVDVGTHREYDELKAKIEESANEKQVRYRTYRTIELSDMILAVKADQIKELLNFALSLRQYANVGSVYTYCGINYDLIKDRQWHLAEEDEAALFSMRFSAENMSAVKGQLPLIWDVLGKEDVFSVVGVDDVVIIWKGLPSRKIVDLYRRWIIEEQPEGMELDKAFSEITTRVGIPFDELDIEERPEPVSRAKLQHECASLLKKVNAVEKMARDHGGERYNWVSPLSSLVHTLFRMSKTSILDEFVYIMLPGASAFLSNVQAYLEELTDTDIQMCRYFVENWAHLMEHIMRIEGQLAHHPDMRPVLYTIPVAMLEYTLAFLKDVVELLQAEDDPQTQICFLLVPRLCEKIEAQELFPAEPDGLPGLVLVSIPLGDLYKPREVQRALCHEASHFVGEKHRNREERRKKYIQAVSALMAKEAFGDMHPALIQVIQTKLMEKTKNLRKYSARDMQAAIIQWLLHFFRDRKAFYDLIRDVFRSPSNHMPIDFKIGELSELKVSRFFELLNDLSILFREVYADICMLSILPISNEEYIDSILPEVKGGAGEESDGCEQFAIRMYVALEASGRKISFDHVKENNIDLYDQMWKIAEGLESMEESEDRLIPMSSVYFLLEYARICGESLRDQKGDQQKCRDMFRNVSSDKIDYSDFLDSINEYRKKMLENFAGEESAVS